MSRNDQMTNLPTWPSFGVKTRVISSRPWATSISDAPWACLALLIASLTSLGIASAEESEFAGLIRSKTPDRPAYSPPTVAPRKAEIEAEAELVPEVEEAYEEPVLVRQRVRQVAHQVSNVPPTRHAARIFEGEASCGLEATCGLEAACGCEAIGYECDGSCMGCDSGCDSFHGGCGGCGGCDACRFNGSRARLSMDPCQWFGSVDFMMMWRVGDGLPLLATTSTAATGTGAIGVATTRPLFGNDRVLDELTAGGRVTLGTWLDDQQCRSLVFRGWGAEQASYGFSTNEDRNAVIARPFFNVTDGVTPANASQIIAAPTQRDGSIDINGSNNVYGGDVSIRQRWLGGLGGYVDVLYGYQYMRMEDDMSIATSSTVLAGQALPAGTVIDVADFFDARNEFHGGQLGLAARYREGCWSFNGTIKAAAGSLTRTAIRSGRTIRRSGAVNAPDPNGLLVRSTNSGTIDDSTFGWVPELDATLGYRWTPNLDLTFGYHVIAMTDALQVSGMIDRDLAVNAADSPTGQQRPSGALRFDTFYVHGIHFGLQCRY